MAAARDADVVESAWKRLGGWSLPDASDNYGLSRVLPMLKEKIDKIEFPNVDFSSRDPQREIRAIPYMRMSKARIYNHRNSA